MRPISRPKEPLLDRSSIMRQNRFISYSDARVFFEQGNGIPGVSFKLG